MMKPPRKTQSEQGTDGTPSIEDLSEFEQDAIFENMLREYGDPSREVVARYAEIGRETERALEKVKLSRSASPKAPSKENTERQHQEPPCPRR
jgi:hypothetical protein